MIIIMYYEYKIRSFSKKLGKTIDDMILGKNLDLSITKETLDDKLNYKLKRLWEISTNQITEAQSEKNEFKSLLGDISHQIKTPITNIKMYNNILIERDMPIDKQIEFLKVCNLQIDKLDFLMQSMIKMSRLETGVIQLHPQNNFLIHTACNAFVQVSQKAYHKKIDIKMSCAEEIIANFDPKWTEEALVNILDNAIKYTDVNGTVRLEVEELEMYVAIHVSDNGIGISEQEQPLIYQRFYRSPNVYDTEGVGVGLALAREIMYKQKGFIKVTSKLYSGSKFSMYLLKDNLTKM